MSWKWLHREQKQEKKKNAMKMHGKGMLRVENDLRNRKNVKVGMKFLDQKHNRELTVVRKTEHGINMWFCESQFSKDVLYAYDEDFILKNLVYEL